MQRQRAVRSAVLCFLVSSEALLSLFLKILVFVLIYKVERYDKVLSPKLGIDLSFSKQISKLLPNVIQKYVLKESANKEKIRVLKTL